MGHKLPEAADPPRPMLGNGEPLIGLQPAARTFGKRRLKTLAVGRRARHGRILPTGSAERANLLPERVAR